MKKKILLIDDKASIAKVVSIYLGKEYDFTYCENPIKAIEWLHEGNMPDLIISNRYLSLCFQVKKAQPNGSDYWKKVQPIIF